jgi:hypothetical protein
MYTCMHAYRHEFLHIRMYSYLHICTWLCAHECRYTFANLTHVCSMSNSELNHEKLTCRKTCACVCVCSLYRIMQDCVYVMYVCDIYTPCMYVYVHVCVTWKSYIQNRLNGSTTIYVGIQTHICKYVEEYA